MTSKTRIQIVTRLDSAIYRSSGGGREVTQSNAYACGPRGMNAALKALSAEKAGNLAGYGNVGCGSSWLRIVEGSESLDLAGWTDWLPQSGEEVPSTLAAWKGWLEQQRDTARRMQTDDDARRAEEDARYAAQYDAEYSERGC